MRRNRQSRDITGKAFGELTPIEPVGTAPDGSWLWLCRCTCGRTALRTPYALRVSLARGFRPCCAECHREVWAGARIDRRNRNIDHFRTGWATYGNLYSPAATERITQDVRSAFRAEFGPFGEAVRLPVEAMPAVATPACRIAHERRTLFRFGVLRFGRFAWMRMQMRKQPQAPPALVVASRAAAHPLAAWDQPHTLEAIGRVLGVSHERVRQIEVKALQKIREALEKRWEHETIAGRVVQYVQIEAAILKARDREEKERDRKKRLAKVLFPRSAPFRPRHGDELVRLIDGKPRVVAIYRDDGTDAEWVFIDDEALPKLAPDDRVLRDDRTRRAVAWRDATETWVRS